MRIYFLVFFCNLFLFSFAQNTALKPEKHGGDKTKIISLRDEPPFPRYDFVKFNPKYRPPAPANRKCSVTEVEKDRKMLHRGEKNADFEAWMKRTIADEGDMIKKNIEIFKIPVVIHILYSSPEENISLEQIMSQLTVLNSDYRRLNSDSTNTPAKFKPLSTDIGIEFALATRTPDGKPTDGIERISLSGAPFKERYINEIIKPNTIWDPSRYLNIWVANLAGGVLGFAQFPESSSLEGIPAEVGGAKTDGVVINFIGFGTMGTVNAPFDKGRTVTHEVGHWLGLRHVWGDGDCSATDYCADTPPLDGPHFGCPTDAQDCTGNNAMIQNFMDYTDDKCMSLFTNDQKMRIQLVLANSPRRKELNRSDAAKPLEIPPIPAFAVDFPQILKGDFVAFQDKSTGYITEREWKFEGGRPALSKDKNPKVSFDKAGKYTISLTATNPYGKQTSTQTALVNVYEKGLSLPQKFDFESDSTNNSLYFHTQNNRWEVYPKVGGFGESANALKIDNYRNFKKGERSWFLLPMMDFSAGTKTTFSFDLAYAAFAGNYNDTLGVYISTDGGKKFRPIYYKFGGNLITENDDTTSFLPKPTQWRKEMIDLSEYDNAKTVQIAFVNFCGYGNNLYLDNIEVAATLSPAPEVDFEANFAEICVGETVQFTDKTKNQPNEWIWSFAGAAQAADSVQNPTVKYTQAGIFEVTLTAKNKIGTHSLTKKEIIVVKPAPVLALTDFLREVCPNSAIKISVTGASKYVWETENGKIDSPTLMDTIRQNTTFVLHGTGENGCSAVQNVSIKVKNSDSLQIFPPAVQMCKGENIAVSVSGSNEYKWFPQEGMNLSRMGKLTVNPSKTTTYKISAKSNSGCLLEKELKVKVAETPHLQVDFSKKVACAGENILLTASGAAAYQWKEVATKRGDAPITENEAAGKYLNFSPQKTTYFSLLGLTENGCKDSIQVEIPVENAPKVAISPENSTICQNQNLTLRASGAKTYQWNWAGKNLNADSLRNIFPKDQNVTLIGYSENGCADTATTFIKVNAAPKLTLAASDRMVCPNKAVILTAADTKTYQWEGSDGYKSPSNTITVAPSKTTTYKVFGTDEKGCKSNTEEITLTIGTNSPPTALFELAETKICGKQKVKILNNSLNVRKYDWTIKSENTTLTSNEPSPEITFSKTGIYSILLQVEGCTGKAELDKKDILTVEAAPDLIVNAEKSEICAGETILLSAASMGNKQFDWSPSESLSKNTGVSVSASPKENTTYKVTVSNEKGCKATTEIAISVKSNPETLKFAQTNPSVCVGEEIKLAVLNGANVQWRMETESYKGREISVKPKKSVTYKISATGNNGCPLKNEIAVKVNPRPKIKVEPAVSLLCKGGQVNLKAEGASSYQWFPATGLSANLGKEVTAFPTKTQTYSILGIDENGCQDSVKITVGVSDLPPVAIKAEKTQICKGASVQLSAQGGVHYKWSPETGLNRTEGEKITATPSETTTYTVTSEGESGCMSVAMTTIEVSKTPPIQILPLNPALCWGDSLSLKVNEKYRIKWEGEVSKGQENATTINIKPSETSIYRISGKDENGCEQTGSVTVLVRKNENARLTASVWETCEGNSVTLEASGGQDFQWLGSSPSQKGRGAKLAVMPKANETYRVVAKDEFGCRDTASLKIGLRKMQAEISLSATEIDLAQGNGLVRFEALKAENTNCLWHFGDGSVANNANPIHIYAKTGKYTVTLQVTDGNCAQTLIKTVSVINSSRISELKAAGNFEAKLNPQSKNLHISFTSPRQMSFVMRILSENGIVISESTIHPKKGVFTQDIDFSTLEKGNFVWELADEKESVKEKIELR